MAGPSIVVRVLGDLKGLSSSFSGAGKAAQGVAATAHGAFSNLLGALNRTGVLGGFGDALAGVDEAIGSIIEHGKKIGPALAGVGAAMVGVGAGLSEAGSKDQAAHQQLQSAIEATGGSYEDYASRIEAAIKSQENYGHTAGETDDALRTLTQATHDPAKALDLLSTASDVAASKHEGLSQAAQDLGKVYNGNTKLLKEFGISIDKSTGKTKDGRTATQALADVTKGQAAASMDTFAGKIDVIKTKLEDTIAVIGQKYGPAIQGIGVTAMAAASVVEVASSIMAAGWFAAFWPIGVAVLALAVLGGAIYLLVTHFKDVINWLKSHWQILVEIIFGPFGIAFVLIAQHFQGVIDAAKAVFNWFARTWPTVVTWIEYPFKAAWSAIRAVWSAVTTAAGSVISWFRSNWPLIIAIITAPINLAIQAVKKTWNDLVGFFTAIPGRIASVASGMWDGILEAFRGMVNGIIDIWNSLHFTLPKIDAGPIHIGGETVGVPHIPHLATGGIITRDGLVYAHAGEAITPARSGPAVVVQNASFSEGIDVEAFMRRVAWTLQTERV